MRYSDNEPTSPKIAESLRPFVAGKTVYDMGAGSGLFALALKERGQASKVVAVEYYVPIGNMPNITVMRKDFMKVDIKQAEVLYCFTSFLGSYALTQKIKRDKWEGTVITQYYPLNDYFGHYYEPHEIIHADNGDSFLPILIYQWYNK